MAPFRRFFPLLLIIFLGYGLRIHRLQAVPLRGDEAFSVLYWADLPLSVSLSEIAHGEPHTPLVYAVARMWRHFVGGIDSVFALRYLSVLGNIIGTPAMFALGWRLSRRRTVGLLAALMFALHPYEIWHSQEFRNYGYWAGLSATALWLGLRLVDRARRPDFYLYAIVAGVAALTIYTESFSTLALTCFAFLKRRHDRPFIFRLVILQIGFGILVSAGLLLLQVRQGFIGYYPGLQPAFSLAEYFTRFVPDLTLGTSLPLDMATVGVILSLLFIFLAFVLHRHSAREFRFVALALVLPLVLLGVVSQRYNLFHPRYVLSSVPAFLLLIALGAYHTGTFLERRLWRARHAIPLLFILPWIILALMTVHAHFNDASFRKAPAWDELGQYLNSRVSDNDLVIQLAVDPAFGYYFQHSATDIGLPVTRNQPATEIHHFLDDISGDYASVYVVAREQAGWENTGVVEAWMLANMQEVLRTDASGLPIRQYLPWQPYGDDFEEQARFGDIVALVGFESDLKPTPTGDFAIWLYWQPLAPTDRPLKSFIHVYGNANPDTGSTLWSQDDQYPQQGKLSSTDWQRESIFRAVHYLPVASLPPGAYRIEAGWYDPETGSRLLTDHGSDTFAIATFEI